MAEEIIKIKRTDEAPKKEESTFTSISESDVQSMILRKHIPINTPTVGRDLKLADDFTVSGMVYGTVGNVTVSTDARGTTETNLLTYNIPKNSIHLGSIIRLTANGYFTSTITPQFTLRVGLGNAPTTTIASMTSAAQVVNGYPWEIQFTGIMTAIGPSGVINGFIRGTELDNVVNGRGTATYDTTADKVFALTCQWSNSTAANSLTLLHFIVEVLG